MEVTTLEASALLGLSQRQIQRAARSSRLVSREVAGRVVVSSKSVIAASRSLSRGRRWEIDTVVAASELLANGNTNRLESSQKSRLRSRLLDASIGYLAYQLLAGRVSFWRSASFDNGVGLADVYKQSQSEQSYGSLTEIGGPLRTIVTDDADRAALESRLVADLDGDIIVVECAGAVESVMREFVNFAYGDTRTSSAAAKRIEKLQSKLNRKTTE